MGGFFGVVSKQACVYDLFYGVDYHSHLGTRRAGMVTYHNGEFARSIHSIARGYFRNKFEPDLDKFVGNSGIGVISDTDSQPLLFNSHLGKFALVTVARINNLKELEKELIEKGIHFSELSSTQINQTELIALLIMQGKTIEEGIQNVYNHVEGSCSMLLLTENGIIAARDKYGRTPIVIGKRNNAFCAAFESCSYQNLGFETEYFLGPAEIVHITAEGFTQLKKPAEKLQICSFLWVYYGYPVTDYEGISVDQVRFRIGSQMGATEATEVDFVSPIPDSGIGMAMGYAESTHMPYRTGVVKYTPTWPRSFTPPNQEMRELVAKMKLIANKALLKGHSAIFCDDSIVRGTQLRDNVEILYNCGAKGIHVRISAPPLLFPCEFINFSASKSKMELIALRCIEELEGSPEKNLELYLDSSTPQYEKMVECIRKKVGVDSLKFSTMDNLVKAIGLPKERICTHCFDGSSCGGCKSIEN